MKTPLEKITIRTFQGDCARLGELFPHIGYNKVIRHMVKNFIKKVESSAEKIHQPMLIDTQTASKIIEDASNDKSND